MSCKFAQSLEINYSEQRIEQRGETCELFLSQMRVLLRSYLAANSRRDLRTNIDELQISGEKIGWQGRLLALTLTSLPRLHTGVWTTRKAGSSASSSELRILISVKPQTK